jgi:hypothetical protein
MGGEGSQKLILPILKRSLMKKCFLFFALGRLTMSSAVLAVPGAQQDMKIAATPDMCEAVVLS